MTAPIPKPARPIPPRKFNITTEPAVLGATKALGLYLGPPKVGKSTLLASWPNPFLVAWDPNQETFLKHHPSCPRVTPDSPEQFERDILPWLLGGGLAQEFPDVETVVVDTLSFMARAYELEILGTANKMDNKGGDWMVFSNRMSRVLGQLTRLAKSNTLPKNYHFIASCHEKEKYVAVRGDGGMERQLVGIDPAVAGQTAGLIAGYFDFVIYVTRGKKNVRITDQTAPGGYRIEQRPHYQALGFEPSDHRAPAGGSLWGHSIPSGPIDATYQGLRAICGLTEGEGDNGGSA